MFVKARQRVIVDVASQRKAFNQLDSSDTGESLAGGIFAIVPVDLTSSIFLLWSVFFSNGSNSASKSALGTVDFHSKPLNFSERDLTVLQLLVDQVSIAISQSNLLKQTRQQVQHEARLNQISLHSLNVVQTVLETVKALQGAGGRLCITRRTTGSLLNCTPMEISLPTRT